MKYLILIIALFAIPTFAYEPTLPIDADLEGFYWKNNQQCAREDNSNTQSTEYCYKNTAIKYQTQVCKGEVQKVDNQDEMNMLNDEILKAEKEIQALKDKIAYNTNKIQRLSRDVEVVNTCSNVEKTKEILVLNRTIYLYKIVNKVKVIYQTMFPDELPKTGVDFNSL